MSSTDSFNSGEIVIKGVGFAEVTRTFTLYNLCIIHFFVQCVVRKEGTTRCHKTGAQNEKEYKELSITRVNLFETISLEMLEISENRNKINLL
jgi:hypothetical protein